MEGNDDKHPEVKQTAHPFTEVMSVLRARMSEAVDLNMRISESMRVMSEAEIVTPPAPGAYLVRDYELIEGYRLQSAWLKRPDDKHYGDIRKRQSAFADGVFVHQVVDADGMTPQDSPNFFIIELMPRPEDDETIFYFVTDDEMSLFVVGQSDRVVALNTLIAEITGYEIEPDEAGVSLDDIAEESDEDFDAEALALSWANEFRHMAPQRFTIMG